jgi:hypothetical protein
LEKRLFPSALSAFFFVLSSTVSAIAEAAKSHPNADVFINYASFRSAYQSSVEALEQPTINVVVIVAEGIPERDVPRNCICILCAVSGMTVDAGAEARGDGAEEGKGHNRPGDRRRHPGRYRSLRSSLTITSHAPFSPSRETASPTALGSTRDAFAGAFKIGDTAGTPENIVSSKLYRPGSVGTRHLSASCFWSLIRSFARGKRTTGFVSKSGGLSNEMYNILAQTTNGLYEGIAIGGPLFLFLTLYSACLCIENTDVRFRECALG